ncbi:hypothetical protein [Fulvivirga ligni]|uniref:hypothetical protein n=1 Tax=Fulvivirga ligni TaxID=2904246 RepID=UPI001F1DF0FF|nr:hypothetical protein [Fulvivirga ligni]UII19138.1 hypothetical protein LVD16_14935 [Fulvivirga ligni]
MIYPPISEPSESANLTFNNAASEDDVYYNAYTGALTIFPPRITSSNNSISLPLTANPSPLYVTKSDETHLLAFNLFTDIIAGEIEVDLDEVDNSFNIITNTIPTSNEFSLLIIGFLNDYPNAIFPIFSNNRSYAEPTSLDIYYPGEVFNNYYTQVSSHTDNSDYYQYGYGIDKMGYTGIEYTGSITWDDSEISYSAEGSFESIGLLISAYSDDISYDWTYYIEEGNDLTTKLLTLPTELEKYAVTYDGADYSLKLAEFYSFEGVQGFKDYISNSENGQYDLYTAEKGYAKLDITLNTENTGGRKK